MKECTKCKEVKELEEFHKDGRKPGKYCGACKSCTNSRHKAYREANREKLKQKSLAYYESNKEKYKAYREVNKEKYKDYYKAYGKTNKEKLSQYMKSYYESNKERITQIKIDYKRTRRAQDPLYKLQDNIRTLVQNAISRQGYNKNTKTAEILGCSFEELRAHLIQTFEMNYCIEYSDEYDVHIDHIYPVSLAQTEEELLSLNHYSNLQYLFAEDNLEKSNKIDFKLGAAKRG